MKAIIKKRIVIYILFVLSIIFLLLYFQPSLIGFDENYSLTLIQHNYGQILSLDSMDVHPPLYYFLLKLFIQITTFYSNNVILEILSARLFSIIASILTFIFLRKITNILGIINNILVQWILFLILPDVLGYFNIAQLSNIRMYSLAALFITIEFYYLLKFSLTNKCIYLITSTIFSSLAAYTHYYSAIFGGGLLLCYFIYEYINKNRKNCKNIFYAMVFLILSFSPWLVIFMRQLNNSNTYWMTNIFEFHEIAKFVVIFIIFLIPICEIYKISSKLFKTQIIMLSLILLSVLLFSIFYSILKGPIFQLRYLYPILLIYEFISVNIIIKLIFKKRYKYLNLGILFILFLSFSKSTIHQVQSYCTSIKLINVYETFKDCKDDDMNVDKFINIHNSSGINNSIRDNNYSQYMLHINKKFIMSNPYFNSFKIGSHIYFNKAYRRNFHNVISKINYRRR